MRYLPNTSPIILLSVFMTMFLPKTKRAPLGTLFRIIGGKTWDTFYSACPAVSFLIENPFYIINYTILDLRFQVLFRKKIYFL